MNRDKLKDPLKKPWITALEQLQIGGTTQVMPLSRPPDPRLLFYSLLDELTMPKEVPISLTCPECGAALSGYICQTCPNNNPKKVAGRFGFIAGRGALGLWGVLVEYVVMPLCGAWLGGVLSNSATGCWVGGLIGISVGIFAHREEERIWGKFLNTSSSPELRLARQYRQKYNMYDMAAACYLRKGVKYDDLIIGGSLVAWLRTYRCAAGVDAGLRQSLFDAIFGVCCDAHISSEGRANTQSMIDAVFTGSPQQIVFIESLIEKEKLASLTRSYNSMFKVQDLLTGIANVIVAHIKGEDIKGVDLRLPDSTSFLQGYIAGDNLKPEQGDWIELAAASPVYCKSLAETVKRARWTDRQHIIEIIFKSSRNLSMSIGGALQKQPTIPGKLSSWLFVLFCAIFSFALGTLVRIDPNSNTVHSDTVLGYIFLVGGFVGIVLSSVILGVVLFRDRPRNKQLARRLLENT